jgi:hypothetical protein
VVGSIRVRAKEIGQLSKCFTCSPVHWGIITFPSVLFDKERHVITLIIKSWAREIPSGKWSSARRGSHSESNILHHANLTIAAVACLDQIIPAPEPDNESGESPGALCKGVHCLMGKEYGSTCQRE